MRVAIQAMRNTVFTRARSADGVQKCCEKGGITKAIARLIEQVESTRTKKIIGLSSSDEPRTYPFSYDATTVPVKSPNSPYESITFATETERRGSLCNIITSGLWEIQIKYRDGSLKIYSFNQWDRCVKRTDDGYNTMEYYMHLKREFLSQFADADTVVCADPTLIKAPIFKLEEDETWHDRMQLNMDKYAAIHNDLIRTLDVAVGQHTGDTIRILDVMGGDGALALKAIRNIQRKHPGKHIEWVIVENDAAQCNQAQKTREILEKEPDVTLRIIRQDIVRMAVPAPNLQKQVSSWFRSLFRPSPQLCQPDQPFDVVVASGALSKEVMLRKDVKPCLELIHRYMSDTGFFIAESLATSYLDPETLESTGFNMCVGGIFEEYSEKAFAIRNLKIATKRKQEPGS